MSHTHAFRKWFGSRRAVATAVAPLIALAGVAGLSTAAQAAVPVAIGTVESQMQNHRGATTSTGNCINFSPNGTTGTYPNTGTSAWQTSTGEALAAHGRTGYYSACPADADLRTNASAIGVTPTSQTTVQTGTPFLLTQMTHYNNPIYISEPSTTRNGRTGSHFLGNLNVRFLGETFTYNYDLTETPNSYSPSSDPRNDDFVIFENQIDETTLNIGGLDYRLVVIGFTEIASGTCPATPSGAYVNEFRTTEGLESIGCLYAELSQVREMVIEKTVDASYGDPATIPTFSFDSDSNLASSPWETDFTLTPTALGAGGTVALPARDLLATEEQVTITEAAPPANWALTALTCSDSAGPLPAGVVTYDLATRTVVVDNVPEVTTAAQSTITCTFTNTYTARGTLTLVKAVDNTGGGTAVPANWDLTATPSGANTAGRTGFTGPGNTAAVTSQSVIAGEYTLSELGNAPVTGDYVQDGEWVCTGTGVTQDPDDPEIITIARDAVATCTVTNTFTYGTLSLVKDVVNGYGTPAAATNWILTATPGTGAGVVDPADDLTEPGGFDPVAVYAGTYSLSETGSVAGYTNGDIWSCVGGTLDSETDTVTVTAGADVVCTITNTADAPTLTLVKQVDNTAAGSLGAGVGDWTLSATNGEENISGVSGADAVTSAQVNEGTYALAEVGDTDATAGYDWTDLTCVQADGTPEGTPIDGVDVDTPNVTLAVGDDVTCTFTNTAQPGSVTWTKVHVGTTDPLADSVWSLTGPGHPAPGTEVTDCVAETCTGLDKDPDAGEFLLEDLTWGDYSLVETSAPPGYIVDDTEHPFQVNADNVSQIVIGPFENVPVTPPTIPLTGGISRDFYTLAGLFVLTLGVGGMGARRFVGRKEAALTP